MQNRPEWRTVIRYVIGLVGLAVSIALALFVPEWYAERQDEKIDGQITLAHRNQITFLDTASLDKAGRMQIYTEASSVSNFTELWTYEYGISDWYTEEDLFFLEQYVGIRPDQLAPKYQQLLRSLSEAGLLSNDCVQPMFTEEPTAIGAYAVNADEQVLTLAIAIFEKDENVIVLVSDQEIEMLYYVLAYGKNVMEYMAQELGYDTLQELAKAYPEQKPVYAADLEQIDLTAISGAESQKISAAQDELKWDAVLTYSNFESYAGREIVSTDWIYGLQIWFGRNLGEEIMEQEEAIYDAELYNTELYHTTTEAFLHAVADGTAEEMINTIETEIAECE